MAIGAIGTAAVGGGLAPIRTPATPAPDSKGDGFGDTLSGLLDSVEQAAGGANSAIANMVAGKGDVHEAMIALHKAQTTLELTVQVRNKLVQAYQDVMRMPI